MGVTKQLIEGSKVCIDVRDPNITIKGLLKYIDLQTGRITVENYVMLNENGKKIGSGDAVVLQNHIWKMIRKGDTTNVIPRNHYRK